MISIYEIEDEYGNIHKNIPEETIEKNRNNIVTVKLLYNSPNCQCNVYGLVLSHFLS